MALIANKMKQMAAIRADFRHMRRKGAEKRFRMDMLIRLYDLPHREASISRLNDQAIQVRRAMPYERSCILEWVRDAFNQPWADECAVAFGRQPVGCYIAVSDASTAICGFCCLDATFKNFVGPIGVKKTCRTRGIGRGLLLAAAHELYLAGYAYAIVGDAGEPGFFKRAVNAVEIPGSTPGAYPPKIGHMKTSQS